MGTPAAGNIIAAKPAVTGGVLTGPLGSTLPTDAKTALDAALVATGYVTEDGLTKSEGRDSTGLKDWAGLTVKTVQTGFEATFAFQFMEYLNEDAAEAVYGAEAVTVTPADATHGKQIAITVKGQEAPRLTWVFEMYDGDAKVRILVPVGQVTAVGDTSFVAGGAAVRDVTVTAYPDEQGRLFIELSDDGVLAA